MDITAVNRSLSTPVAEVPQIPPRQAAENRSIIQAVKAVNGTEMFGPDNHLAFQRDPESQRMVVQVINQRTHEVVAQIPAEYVLRLSQDLEPLEANDARTK